jgi:hypothetical protein
MKRNPFDPIKAECQTCRFWEEHPNTGGGACKRYAPRPFLYSVETPSGEEPDNFADWPRTLDSEWCGEYSEDPTR